MTENKIWNIGGAVLGVVLGILAALGILTSQTSAKIDQVHSSVIAYDEAS